MTPIKCSIPTGFQVLPYSTRTVAGMLDFTGPIPVDSSGFLQEWGGHCKVLGKNILKGTPFNPLKEGRGIKCVK